MTDKEAKKREKMLYKKTDDGVLPIRDIEVEYYRVKCAAKEAKRKSLWKCIVKIAPLLLIEIALVVSGVLVNELTALQYTPIAIWCGVIALAPFAYKISKEALIIYENTMENIDMWFSQATLVYNCYTNAEELTKNDTNITI